MILWTETFLTIFPSCESLLQLSKYIYVLIFLYTSIASPEFQGLVEQKMLDIPEPENTVVFVRKNGRMYIETRRRTATSRLYSSKVQCSLSIPCYVNK